MLSTLALLSVLAFAPIPQPVGHTIQQGRTPLPEPTQAQIPGLDQALAKIAAEEYEFHAMQGEVGAPNRAQVLRLKISARGLRIEPRQEGEWKLVLSTKSVARDSANDARAQAGAGVLTNSGARAEIAHGGWSEWFENRESGIEQGWTISAKPEGEGALYVKLGVEGDLSLRIADETGGSFHRANGDLALRYAGLKASDASGRVLRARLLSHGGCAAIEVDDAGASYPITIDPVITGPVWTYESNQATAQLGFSVAAAGDVNADGYSDVLVGVPYWDGGAIDEGRALLFLGSATGLSATPSWSYASGQATARLGSSVACAGDLDADGFADVVVGAPNFDTPSTDAGKVFVFRGSASGLSVAPWTSLQGSLINGRFGSSVAAAGDVNGDGYGDLLVGAPNFANGQAGEGEALLYLGASGGVGGTPAWSIEGNAVNAQLGSSVSSAGDVDGDGLADVIIGAPGLTNTLAAEGGALLFHGTASGLSATPWANIWGGQIGAQLGSQVSRAGDVNGDGYADVIVSAPFWSGSFPNEGRCLVFLGSSSGLGLSAAWTRTGGQANANLGRCACAGDVNGDGYADIVVADNYSSGLIDEGRALLFLGASTGLANTPAWTGLGGQAGAVFGSSVAGAGDVNGDGFGDLLIGAPGCTNGQVLEGRAYLFQGCAAGMSSFATWSNFGSQAGGEYGVSVSIVGDLNGDGYSDFVVGAYQESSANGTNSGRAYVYLGSSLFTLPISAGSVDGPSANARFGNWVAGAGDVNGDGYDDFIVGARDASHPEAGEGMAFVYYGSATGFNSTPASIFEGNQVGAGMGQCVASAGDINGDGYSDVLIGTYKWDAFGAQDQGKVDLYLGSAAGLGATPSWTLVGAAPGDRLGSNVAGAGDVDGDGYSDFLVSAYLGGAAGTGYVECFRGTPTGPVGPIWVYSLPQANSHVSAIASCGDLNGDGYSDIVLGSNDWTGTLNAEGAAFVFNGGPLGPAASPSWTHLGGQAGCSYGTSVSSAGDVNGDGYSDLLVTAIRFSNGQSEEGAAYVYLGSATGLAAGPVWTVEGNQDFAWLGVSATGPGDVNGDGFSDVLLGGRGFGFTQQNQGSATLYLGNGAVRGGSPVGARPVKLNGAPLGLLDKTSDVDFKLRARANGAQASASTPGGRGRARLEWQIAPPGQSLGATSVHTGTWSPTGPIGSSLTLESQVQGTTGGLDTWRVRNGFGDPLFPHGPWLSMPGNAVTELDLRSSPDCNGNGVPDATEPDCNGNGSPDSCDIASGSVPDCNLNGIPDSCDLASGGASDCNGNGIPDFCDIASGSAADCNANGVPDSCDLASGAAQDCNGNGIPDTCDISDGSSTDCNGNDVPDSCELASGTAHDCNGNGVLDSCDIANGSSTDCNGNGYPDSCDIAGGGADCNGNGLLDSCDISSGFSQDVNLDGVPDSCQTQIASMCFGDGSGTPCPCNNLSAAGRGCPNSNNAQGALLQASGLPSKLHDAFVLSGSNMPTVSNVLYFQGTQLQNGGLGIQWGDGLACVGGAVIRLGVRVNSGGASSFGPGIATLGQIPIGGGVTRYYQGWYRDSSASFCTANTFNFTNAISVVWIP